MISYRAARYGNFANACGREWGIFKEDVLKSRGSNAGKGHNCYCVRVFTNLLARE